MQKPVTDSNTDNTAIKNIGKKNVGIWIRVSTEDQAKGESPEHHEKRARFYAESKDWNIREVYHLEAVSGKAVINHPEAQRMLSDIKKGRITGLIFSKIARLARNTRELLEFADIFEQYGADLISLQESIDTSTPAGRLFYTMISAMAQWEREEISSRISASVAVRAKLGKSLGGVAPYGYQWKDKKLIVDPKEAPVRKLMYEIFLETKRKKTTADILNKRGYRTRTGAKFADTTIHRLLSDPIAKGLRRINYSMLTDKDKKWVLKPKEEWCYVKVEPIISDEIWEQCNNILEKQLSHNRKIAKKSVQLFSGFTFCHCKRKMYVPSNMPKYVCSGCRTRISVDDLEKVFHHQLKNFFFSPKEIAQYLENADKTIKGKQELLASIEKEKQKVKSEMDKIMQLYLSEQISVEGFGKEYKPLEERFKQIDEQTPQLQGEIDFLKIKLQSSDEIISEAKDLYSRWTDLKREEKRHIIEQITEKITIGKGEITIDLCYLPTSAEITAKRQHNPMDV